MNEINLNFSGFDKKPAEPPVTPTPSNKCAGVEVPDYQHIGELDLPRIYVIDYNLIP